VSGIRYYPQMDVSGGIQYATNPAMRKQNELANGRNGRFGIQLGSYIRRNGCTQVGSVFSASNAPTGAFIARFTTGNKRFVAVNNDADTATIVRVQDSATGAWTTLTSVTGYPADAKVFFFLDNDEVYISGYNATTGAPLNAYNVDKTLDVSAIRNILNMPAAYFIEEFNGSLYAGNVTVNSVRYPNRLYKSSGLLGSITFVQAAHNGLLAYITVDSVRYLKAGMMLDIYAAGGSTKLYDVTITSVDRPNKRVYFTRETKTFTAATTDILTVSSTTLYPTGTPVQVSTTGTLPTGLAASTTYYVINLSATTMKLATTAALATAGTAIDITATGSGTHTLNLYYNLADNDELWLDGRYGLLTRFWNIDHPEPARADWTSTRPGTDSSNAITGMRKSSNRLVVFTRNSAQKWDGGNMVTFSSSVGCIAPHSIQNIDDDWLVWVDAKGHIHARNDSSGQQEYISRGLYELIMKYVPQANLITSSSTVINNTYMLYLGTVDVGRGNENLRIVYSFDDNNWAIDSLGKKALFQGTDDYTGTVKPYFFSDDGKLYIDDTGNTDGGVSIPFVEQTGRSYLGTRRKKKFIGVIITSHNAKGAKVKIAVGNGQHKEVGEIQKEEEYIEFPPRLEIPTGGTADLIIDQSTEGAPQKIEGIEWVYNVSEETPASG
jgi:hypothetical protein